jgi:GNAT superfamily N-acetyltransferase
MTTDTLRWLTLPGAPTIPGLRVRPYADARDIPPLVELHRMVNRADGNTEIMTADELRLHFDHWTNVDPREDELLVFVDDGLVATSKIEWLDANDGRRFYVSNGRVHPGWRRRGIGAALMSRNERRLVGIATSHPDSTPRVLVTYAEDSDRGAIVLARARGYERVRVYHHLVRPDLDAITVPPLPDGLEVRPMTRELLPRLWDAMSEAFSDHFGGDDTSPAAYRRWSEDRDLDLSLHAVAFDGDEIAGGVLGYIVPEENEEQGYLRGWTDPVFTRRPWRRRGLAFALLARALALLRDRGMTSAQLGVDSQNAYQAFDLYERHGFRTVRGMSEWHKPLGRVGEA